MTLTSVAYAAAVALSVIPGPVHGTTPGWTVNPQAPIITSAPLVCQYDVTGAHHRIVTVGLALGQTFIPGDLVTIEVVKGGAAWAAFAHPDATTSYVWARAPFGGAGSRHYITVTRKGVVTHCGRT